MKKLINLLYAVFSAMILVAQTPQSFQYQSVVRDGSGNVVVNQPVSFRISLISGSATGTVMYAETHSATTNAFGIVTLTIGEGIVETGSMVNIDWASAEHFIKVEADITGGTAYVDMGTTQLLSVPYALLSKTSEDAFSGNYNDLNGIPVYLSSFSNDVGYITSPNDADADPTNEMQTLSIAGNNLTIIGGNTVALPQTTYTAGSGINVTGTTITNTSPDQAVTLAGSGATSVTGTYPNFTISSTDNVNDADADPANEIQALSLAGNTLSLSGGGSVSLSNYVDTLWRQSGNLIYNTNAGNVGIGTTTPPGKLVVQGDALLSDSEPLFEVKDRTGSTVFVVYQDSVRIYVYDDGSKTNKGAFAVSGRNTAKQPTNDFLLVTPDSSRVYTGDEASGFGVRHIGSGTKDSYMKLTPDNYFIGHKSGNANITGMYNNYLGYEAGLSNTTGYYNVFLGYTAGRNNIVGSSNTFLGFSAGWNSNGQENIAVGSNALGNSNTGSSNVAVGNQALSYNTTGEYNVAIGNNSLNYNTIGNYNVAVGAEAAKSNSSGSRNISMGYQSLFNNTSGNENVMLGYRSGYTNTTGSNNVFLGYYSGYMNNANYNVFLGYESGRNNTSGTNNAFMGYQAGRSNITGISNVFIGDNAGFTNSGGSYNLAIGMRSLYSNNSADNNIGIGYQVLYTNSTGWSNLAIGNASMYYNTTGPSNVAVGEQALYRNTTGGANVAVGKYTLYYNTGNDNTAVGNGAYFSFSATAYNNSSALGAGSVITASNQVRVGNSSVTSIGGQVGWTTLSDKRFKTNVKENVPGLEFILKLKPVTYNVDIDALSSYCNIPDSLRRKDNEKERENITQCGFLAQDVEKAAIESGFDFSGIDKPKNEKDFYGLRYAEFTVPLVRAIQEQQVIIENQQKQIDELKNENAKLQSKVQDFDKLNAEIENIKATLGITMK